jgi:hypothetical protein
VNAPGGRTLYDAAAFAEKGIELAFCDPVLTPYQQPAVEFVPGLSILDVLMHNPKQRVLEMIQQVASV